MPPLAPGHVTGGTTITGGTFTVNYLLDPANPTYASAPGMKLYRQIMAKYDPKGNVNDQLNVYGMAKAWTTVQIIKAAGKNLADHATHLVVHGVLHLLGYDHETARAAKIMEPLETRILSELGIDDPYARKAA